MGRLSTEERHKRQKEKLDKKNGVGVEEKTSEYVPQPNLKKIVCNAANDFGYKCYINDDSVVMFCEVEKRDEIKKWLFENYAVPEIGIDSKELNKIPFSFGFKDGNSVENDENEQK